MPSFAVTLWSPVGIAQNVGQGGEEKRQIFDGGVIPRSCAQGIGNVSRN